MDKALAALWKRGDSVKRYLEVLVEITWQFMGCGEWGRWKVH